MGKFKKVEIIILAVLVVVLAGAIGGKVFLKKEEPVQTKKVEKPKNLSRRKSLSPSPSQNLSRSRSRSISRWISLH